MGCCNSREESGAVRFLLVLFNNRRSRGCVGPQHWQSCVSERAAVRGLRHYRFWLQWWLDGQRLLVCKKILSVPREVILTPQQTELVTCRVAKWAFLRAESSVTHVSTDSEQAMMSA